MAGLWGGGCCGAPRHERGASRGAEPPPDQNSLRGVPARVRRLLPATWSLASDQCLVTAPVSTVCAWYLLPGVPGRRYLCLCPRRSYGERSLSLAARLEEALLEMEVIGLQATR